MFRRDPKAGPAIRALCEPLAAQHGLHYDRVMLGGPDTDAEWALFFARFGASLVLSLAEQDGYPGDSGRARRRGARAVARSFGNASACAATVFMGHALFEHMAAIQDAYGEGASAEAYRNVRALLSAFYPLAAEDERALEDCLAELRNLQRGTAPAVDLNGFHRAARAGHDPREDADLVELQRRTVGEHFRRSAAAHAVELCVGATAFAELSTSFLWPASLSAEALAFGAGELATWSSISERFSAAVSEFLDSLPDPD